MEQFIEWDTIFTIMCWAGMVVQARLIPHYFNVAFVESYCLGSMAPTLQGLSVFLMFPFFFLQ